MIICRIMPAYYRMRLACVTFLSGIRDIPSWVTGSAASAAELGIQPKPRAAIYRLALKFPQPFAIRS